MNETGFTIDLLDSDTAGLIIACKSGVTYTNQVGGYACRHPEIEGVFVPLPTNISEQLEAFFTGPKWNGRCYDEIDEETASFVDSLLQTPDLGGTLCVDRARFKESCEAWIRVKVSMNSLLWPGLNDGEGVLTWQNSD